MKNIIIEATNKTPHIDFNAATGVLKLSGRVIPQNSIELFEPLNIWFNEFRKQPPQNLVLEVKCEYLNEDAKFFILLFHALIDLTKLGFKVTVKWHYDTDDPDLLEAGEDYEAFSALPFEFIEVNK